MINKILSLSVILAGSILPAQAYPTITEWERIDCNPVTETILKCDRYKGQTGIFIESYYLDRYTNEYTFEDPREIQPDIIEEEPDTDEVILEDDQLHHTQIEYIEEISTTDPLLNNRY